MTDQQPIIQPANTIMLSNKEHADIAKSFFDGVQNYYKETGLELTPKKKDLVMRYFLSVLSTADAMRESHDIPEIAFLRAINWKKFYRDMHYYINIELEPDGKNGLSILPFFDKKTNTYTLSFCPGVAGLESIAREYGIDPPQFITCELVCQNDIFSIHKKDCNHPCETYTFEIDTTNRGECIGGFYYTEYAEPRKNKITFLSLKELTKKENPKNKIWTIERQKMLLKTLQKAAWRSIPIKCCPPSENDTEDIIREEIEHTAIFPTQDDGSIATFPYPQDQDTIEIL